MTLADTVIEVYQSSDGRLAPESVRHILGKDDGCGFVGPTYANFTVSEMGATYYFLVGLIGDFASSETVQLKVAGDIRPITPSPPAPPRPPPSPPRPPMPPVAASAIDNLGTFMMLMPNKIAENTARNWCINACDDTTYCSTERFATPDTRAVYAHMYCNNTNPAIVTLWRTRVRTSDDSGYWYQVESLASGGCLTLIKEPLYWQSKTKAYRILVTACNSDDWEPSINNQLWQFRADPSNTTRYVLVPWGPDANGKSPQCASSCWSSTDTNCSTTGYYPSKDGGASNSRNLFSEVCESLQGKTGDPYESLSLLQVTTLPMPPPPRPPAPPRPPSPPPPRPPANGLGTFIMLMPKKDSTSTTRTWCISACDTVGPSGCSTETFESPDIRPAFAYKRCSKTSPSVLSMWQAQARTSNRNGVWYQLISMASGGCLTLDRSKVFAQADDWKCLAHPGHGL
jgi:hypothetical protein